MTNDIDGWDIAAQIRLVRQIHKGTILILEGETDAKVFDRFIDSALCDIEVGFGKKNVLEALDLLEDDGFAGVVAVVDADFDRILAIKHQAENLCLTESHDLDLTIFASSAFDRYVKEHAELESLKRVAGNDLIALRRRIVDASLPLACCRLVAQRDVLDLYFKDLKHEQFVRIDDLYLESDSLFAEIISRSSTSCTVARLKARASNEAVLGHDIYQLTNGHDVAAILGISLRKLLASRRTAQTWASEIEAGMRLAFDWEAFASTGLYRCLKTWEVDNPPYRIFRELSLAQG